MKSNTKWVIATIIAIIGLVIAGAGVYYETRPAPPPQVESFKMAASLANEFSRSIDITNCNVTSLQPTVEEYLNTFPQTVDILIQNVGNAPLYIQSLDMHNNYTGNTWVGDVPLLWGTAYATIPTGQSQVYGLIVPTAGWNTNGIVALHFTATTNDGTAHSTDLLLRAIFRASNSTTTSTTITSTTTTTLTGSTYSCPITVPVPHQTANTTSSGT